jgi:proteasome-associated ATPase
MPTQDYLRLLQGEEMPPEEERALLEALAIAQPKALPALLLMLANHRRQLRGELRATQERSSRLEAELARALEPPWYPADILHVRGDGRIEIAVAGRRQVVSVAPGLELPDLRAGDEVLLGREQNVVIARGESARRAGAVGVVDEVRGERVVLRGVGDDEIAAACAAELAAVLRPGDRVLYRRDSLIVLERLEQRTETPYLLERTPATTFDDVGGLDSLLATLRNDLDVHLERPDLVHRFSLRLMRGLVLIGPPGNGKTLVARAIANHLARGGHDTRFLSVKPGALRGSLYGQTEKNIRELFATARAHPGLVVIFLDEIDSFGARGAGIGQDIDGRVLGTLLTELDGVESADNIFCIAATNRLDLCDDALVRSGRLGERVYRVPRPGRAAARQIFAKYLTPELAYRPTGDGREPSTVLIEAAVAHLYHAADGSAGALATVTLASSERRAIRAPDVVSGALIASAVESAKRAAAVRHLVAGRTAAGEPVDLGLEDLLDALDGALAAEVEKLRTPLAARRMLDFRGAEEIVRVDVPTDRPPSRHRYLRAA